MKHCFDKKNLGREFQTKLNSHFLNNFPVSCYFKHEVGVYQCIKTAKKIASINVVSFLRQTKSPLRIQEQSPENSGFHLTSLERLQNIDKTLCIRAES